MGKISMVDPQTITRELTSSDTTEDKISFAKSPQTRRGKGVLCVGEEGSKF